MLSTTRAYRLLTVSSRFLHTAPPASIQAPGRDPHLSQGNVNQPRHGHQGDPQDQAAREGQRVRKAQEDSGPYDAASRVGSDKKAGRSGLSGNKEGVGFAEQVGSSTPSAEKGSRPSSGEGKGQEEESMPPGFFASVKHKLGLGTSSDEVKQNRGGGVGVTGTGALPFEKKPEEGRRPYHTSAVRAEDKTKGQAPSQSRRPKDRTNGEQNEHLQHKSAKTPDSGRGAAADDPKLPSHEMDNKRTGASHQRRSFSTSAQRSAKHTAESYFKEVDKAPPASQKTYQVDNSATGSDVQRPDEPLSGEWSRAGAKTKEYETVSEDDKYDLPPSSGPEKEQKMRYGNTPGYDSSQRSSESSDKANQGPEGASKGGRKPERP